MRLLAGERRNNPLQVQVCTSILGRFAGFSAASLPVEGFGTALTGAALTGTAVFAGTAALVGTATVRRVAASFGAEGLSAAGTAACGLCLSATAGPAGAVDATLAPTGSFDLPSLDSPIVPFLLDFAGAASMAAARVAAVGLVCCWEAWSALVD